MPTVATWSMRRWLPSAHSTAGQKVRAPRTAQVGDGAVTGGAARAGETRRAPRTRAIQSAGARPRWRGAPGVLGAVFIGASPGRPPAAWRRAKPQAAGFSLTTAAAGATAAGRGGAAAAQRPLVRGMHQLHRVGDADRRLA